MLYPACGNPARNTDTCAKEEQEMATETANTDTRVDKLDKMAGIIAKLDDESMNNLEKYADTVLAAQQGESDGR